MSLGYLRVLTAGESHGPQLTIFVENLPAGMPVLAEDIDLDLARRQKGYGRGGRQQIEHDCVEIVAGVRHGKTMGGPIAMVVKNRDWANWQGKMDIAPVADPPPRCAGQSAAAAFRHHHPQSRACDWSGAGQHSA